MSAAPFAKYIPAPVIIERVAGFFALDVVAIRGPVRSQGLHVARCIAAVLLLEHTPLSRVEIGRALGRKHPAAGLDLLTSAARQKDERFLGALEEIRQQLTNQDGAGHV